MFKNIYNEKLDKIEELNKKIDYSNLKCTVISTGEEFELDKSENSLASLNDIKTSKICPEKANNLQRENNEYLREIQKRNKVMNKKKL